LGINANSNFGLTEIEDFTTGSVSTSDIFDYKSNLVSGNGTLVSSDVDLNLNSISSGDRSKDIISANNTAVLEFESNKLTIDITSSSDSQITDAVEALLESVNASSNLTGTTSAVKEGGINTDTLLIFHEADNDAVIIRYQEGSTSDADFNGELSVVAIFDTLAHSGSNLFENTNIV
ncbi:MAG: hypothetical protein ACKVH8_25030, partial [Pirellulales bacterium]